MVAGDRRVDTGVTVHQVHRIEAKVTAVQHVALVDGAVVEQVLEVGGVVVWHIRDVLEGVCERRDDEGVVESKGALEEVEADLERMRQFIPHVRIYGNSRYQCSEQ